MKTLVIDRFEEEVAVCEQEDGSFVHIPKDRLPAAAREGDILRCGDDGYTIDTDETARRKQDVFDLQQRLFHRSDN